MYDKTFFVYTKLEAEETAKTWYRYTTTGYIQVEHIGLVSDSNMDAAKRDRDKNARVYIQSECVIFCLKF